MDILVLNCGSSSARFAVLEAGGRRLFSGEAERLGTPLAALWWNDGETRATRAIPGADHDRAVRELVALLRSSGLLAGIRAVGHRVVHGGAEFTASTLVTPEVLRKISGALSLGPLHIPPNLLGIRAAQELLPSLPQVAVFDTAFHQTLPPKAFTYAVPLEWRDQHGVRRYGFHGTSHRYVSGRALEILGLARAGSRLVTAHLGNGCSCAAVLGGRSVDTTMGLTPLEGVVMGTRSGSVDPAIVAHMARVLGRPGEEIVDLLNTRSGLLGLSGRSNDMRTVQAAADGGDERARLAVEVFCYVLSKAIASLVVPLGGLDALVFTGGIGEHAVEVRARVVEALGFLGLRLDAEANGAHGRDRAGRISAGGPPHALVVPTDEEYVIAADAAELLAGARQPGP